MYLHFVIFNYINERLPRERGRKLTIASTYCARYHLHRFARYLLFCYKSHTILSILQIRKPKLGERKYLAQEFKTIDFLLSLNARGQITYSDILISFYLWAVLYVLSLIKLCILDHLIELEF